MCAAISEPVAVAILAKAPLPGLAKTRLHPALGADLALPVPDNDELPVEILGFDTPAIDTVRAAPLSVVAAAHEPEAVEAPKLGLIALLLTLILTIADLLTHPEGQELYRVPLPPDLVAALTDVTTQSFATGIRASAPVMVSLARNRSPWMWCCATRRSTSSRWWATSWPGACSSRRARLWWSAALFI